MKSSPFPKKSTKAQLESFAALVETVHKLRAPNGCPWDRAQTHQSLRPYLIEEAYEVLDVIDQIQGRGDLQRETIRTSFREELGDLLMQVLLHSEMASETESFTFWDVAKTLNQKLIRRHPHVFGDEKADSAASALKNWEKQKAKEKESNPESSILEGLPKNLPALQKTARVIEKVTQVGFQWEDMKGPLDKMNEELNEFKEEVLFFENCAGTPKEGEAKRKLEAELGDLLFTLCNVAYLMKLNPEDALRGTLSRFQRRFQYVERQLKLRGKSPESSNLPEMDQYWNDAKKIEKANVWGLTGGIGSGKSTVAQIFSDLGLPVLDADAIAREIRNQPGPAQTAIIERFGTHDPSRLREIVFENPSAKIDLEKILHPFIQTESQRKIESLAAQYPVVIYEASLLIETRRHLDFDGTLVVEAPHDLRIQRVQARDGLNSSLIERIMKSQISDEERRKNARFIFSNSGSMNELRSQVIAFAVAQGWTTARESLQI